MVTSYEKYKENFKKFRRLTNNNILLNPLLGVNEETISRMLQRYEPGKYKKHIPVNEKPVDDQWIENIN